MFQEFEKALIALQQGELLNCLTINGRAVCSVTIDIMEEKFNDGLSRASASELTGSGPAVVIIIIALTVERIKSTLERIMPKEQIIETKFLSYDSDEIEME